MDLSRGLGDVYKRQGLMEETNHILIQKSDNQNIQMFP
jgi:hypothetical protein